MLIRYYVYGLPRRIKIFFVLLGFLIIVVATFGILTSQGLNTWERMSALGLVLASLFLLYFVLRYRSCQAEVYRKAIDDLKQEIEETDYGVRFKTPMLVTEGTLKILFNPMRSSGFRRAAKMFKFEPESEPIDVEELKITEVPTFILYKHPLTVVIKTKAWKLVDPRYAQHEIYFVLLPSMTYEERTERFELTSGVRTIELIARFQNKKLEIATEGSQNDEVQLEVNYGEDLVQETITLKGGEKTTLPLLPRQEEKAILVIHGKSVKMIDANSMQLAVDIAKDLNIEQIDVSEYLATTEPITIKAKFHKTLREITLNQPIKIQ